MIAAEKLQKLKEKLPGGYYKIISERTGISEKTLSLFFTGVRYREDIHEAALKLAQEHQSKLKDLELKTEKIINS